MEYSALLSRTAAALAAAAIYEQFPGSELLGGGATSTGFFYHFSYPHAVPPEAPRMLEERMRQMIREDRPLREMEMVACSARELFAKAEHFAAVDLLTELGPKELVSVVKIGTFCDLMEGPFCKQARDVGAFQLLVLQPLGDHEYRLEGCAFASKDNLKKFLRTYAHYADKNHLTLGQKLKLWQPVSGGFFWTDRGLVAKRAIASLLRGAFSAGERALFATDRVVEQVAVQRVQKGSPFALWIERERAIDPAGDSGFFEEDCQSTVEQRYYCEEEDLYNLATFLLQTAGKAFTILGFHTEVCLVGRRQSEKSLKLLEQALGATLFADGVKVPFESDREGVSALSKVRWVVKDGLGRSQIGLELELQQVVEEKRLFMLRVNAGVERILSLLLEQNGERLPEWLFRENMNRTVKLEN